MAERLTGHPWRCFELKLEHDLMVTEPEAVTDALLEVAVR
jgi:hypothetical protein